MNPQHIEFYRRHVEGGESIRSLAREAGLHASTVMRRIRRFEARRDDPLVDSALARPAGNGDIDAAALPILRRLVESGAELVVFAGMDKAIVVRDGIRTAVLDRQLGERIALAGWIAVVAASRLRRYAITPAGRAALCDMLPPDRPRVLAETPLMVLARRCDGAGRPFLTPDLVAAGERLRTDFEVDAGSAAVCRALNDLGPKLGDLVVRVCCYREGIETAERALGWPARSGKLVLRLALMQLRQHYLETEEAS